MSKPHMADSLLMASVALPAGAATVTSPAIDLEVTIAQDDFLAQTELRITIPALTTGQLADTHTITYSVLTSANADLSSPTVIDSNAYVQTGAGGVGSVGGFLRYRPTTNTQRYIGFQAVKTGSESAAGATATAQLVF